MMKAYSYVRFSTDKQLQGDSVRRQTELSTAYAKANDLELDDSLHLHDLGVSAYKGKNVVDGKLGAFIQAVDDGLVSKGSYLLVESLDRLSRDQVLESLSLFTTILNKDIKIVTLQDSKVYSKESLNDIGNLLFSLIIMSRAHEESAIKSKRIKAAWQNKQQNIQNKILTKTCPFWLDYNNNSFVINEQYAKIINVIFEMYVQGYGYALITKHLNKNYEPFAKAGRQAKCWYQSYIPKIISNPAVVGTFKDVPNYYPAIISQNLYIQAQNIRNNKKCTGGRKAAVVNIFQHLLKCGKCCNSAIRTNQNKIKSGKIYYRVRIACSTGRSGVTDCTSTSWDLDDLENRLLKSITEVNILQVIGDVDDDILKDLNVQLNAVQYKLNDLTKQKNNIVQAISVGGDIPALVQKLQELDTQITTCNKQLKQINNKINTEQQKYNIAKLAQDEIIQLQNHLEDNDNRLKLNTAIKKLVDKIVLYIPTKKFVIHYNSSKSKVGFKSGVVVQFPEKDVDPWD